MRRTQCSMLEKNVSAISAWMEGNWGESLWLLFKKGAIGYGYKIYRAIAWAILFCAGTAGPGRMPVVAPSLPPVPESSSTTLVPVWTTVGV